MVSWPNGAPRPGDRAELSRRVEADDIRRFTAISGDRNPLHYDERAAGASRFRAPVRPGDEITGTVEVLEVRDDKPITRLRTTVTRQDGTVVLEGTAVCYTMTLE
jgi:acyl dehydratase